MKTRHATLARKGITFGRTAGILAAREGWSPQRIGENSLYARAFDRALVDSWSRAVGTSEFSRRRAVWLETARQQRNKPARQ